MFRNKSSTPLTKILYPPLYIHISWDTIFVAEAYFLLTDTDMGILLSPVFKHSKLFTLLPASGIWDSNSILKLNSRQLYFYYAKQNSHSDLRYWPNDFLKRKTIFLSFWKIVLVNIFYQSRHFAVFKKQTCEVFKKPKNFTCLNHALLQYL